MLCLDPRLIIKVTAVLVCREMKEIDEPGRTGWGGYLVGDGVYRVPVETTVHS